MFLCVPGGQEGPGGRREGGKLHVVPQKSRKVATWKVPIWGRAAGSQGPPSLAYNPARLAESKEQLKSFLVKEESEKVGLKLNIQKRKIMASGPITSWQTDGKQ